MLPNIISIVLLALATYFVCLNWMSVHASYRLRKRGGMRHVSTTPLIVQILAWLAAFATQWATNQWLPSWIFWLVALSDVALLQVVYLPVALFRQWHRTRK